MNIGSVDPNFTGSRAFMEMHNLLLDQETFGTHKREFYYQADKPKVRVQPWSFTYKNFDALDKSSTQFDLGTNFF
jgi:hypothetical protein